MDSIDIFRFLFLVVVNRMTVMMIYLYISIYSGLKMIMIKLQLKL